MARRGEFLVCVDVPDLVKSNIFHVAEGAVRLTAALSTTAYIEVAYGDPENRQWTLLVRNGKPVVLSSTNNQHVELVPGVYRVVSGDEGFAPGDTVYMEEDEFIQRDKNVMFIHSQTNSGGSL